MIIALTLLTVCVVAAIVYMIVEQQRHRQNLDMIPVRILVNGIRGKSSITRLIAGALRADQRRIIVAKTTGTAARFLYPDGTESAIQRKAGIVNVIEQKQIVRRARELRADILVMECMAVDPDLQELNQRKLVKSTIGVLCNVREDHMEEMGGPERTLDNIARSLARSMPTDGVCVTAERDRFDILADEAHARNTALLYANPYSVTSEEMKGFSWITFPENVAIALSVAGLCGVRRDVALAGMYAAEPDPGVLRVEQAIHAGKRYAAVNLFAANDPESTVMNVDLLLERGIIGKSFDLVINCRPDRVERNGQMGAIVEQLVPERVFLIGAPTKSALDHIAPHLHDRVIDLGGDERTGDDLLQTIAQYLHDDPTHALIMVGNIHGRGEHLLEAIARSSGTLDNELAALLHESPSKTIVMPENAPTVVLPRITV